MPPRPSRRAPKRRSFARSSQPPFIRLPMVKTRTDVLRLCNGLRPSRRFSECTDTTSDRLLRKGALRIDYNAGRYPGREATVKIAVLFGGESMERDVSVASASQVVGALRARGHEVVAVDAVRGVLPPAEEKALLTGRVDRAPPSKVDRATLPAVVSRPDLRAADLVFLALHGGTGEDGTVQAVLDLAGITYTGSGRIGSALGMDKDVAKRLFLAAGVPTPDWLMAPASVDAVRERLGFPVIVKPNGQGSTVGLTLVERPEDLQKAIDEAGRFDDAVMIERYIAGRELTVGILDDEPLAVGEIVPRLSTIFDYASKYQAGGADEIFPADLTPE